MKKRSLDEYIISIVIKNIDLIVVGVLLLLSVYIRFYMMVHSSSNDYDIFIVPWIETYRKSIADAFREGVGDYYIPYNVFLAIASLINVPAYISVGLFSCVFDYLTAFTIYKLLTDDFGRMISKKIAASISVVYLFIPTIVLNGAAWKQCDAIYAFFLVVLIKCLIEDKVKMAFIMLGISLSFKQQAIFILPLIIILYFANKNIKIIYSIYTLIVYLIAGLPAIAFGRSIKAVYAIYYYQMGRYREMTLNYPNFYMITMTDYEECHTYAIILTIAIFAIAFLLINSYYGALNHQDIVTVATWSIWTCCMFLPAMHQRYDYMVAILLVICLPLIRQDRRILAVISMLLFYLGNTITYCYSLFGDDYNNIFVMCCNVLGYFVFTFLLWNILSHNAKITSGNIEKA